MCVTFSTKKEDEKIYQFHYSLLWWYNNIDSIPFYILPARAYIIYIHPPIVESWINIFPRVHFSAPNFQSIFRVKVKKKYFIGVAVGYLKFFPLTRLFSTKYKRSYSRWTKYNSEYKTQIHSNKCNAILVISSIDTRSYFFVYMPDEIYTYRGIKWRCFFLTM